MKSNEKLVTLLASLAYREGEFRLSSGRMSNFYLDAKQVTYHPDGVRLVGESVLALARQSNVESVGGLTMGADAIIISTVWASLADGGTAIPGFVVRKDKKAHGLGKNVEGVTPAGKRVAIVEDVITTGDSIIKAVEAARADGAEVVIAIAVVDREEGGRAAIEQLGVRFHALCTISEIRERSRATTGAPV